MGPRLARRLLIAFLVIAFTAILCWKVLPRIGVDVPWWVPFVGFGVILFATLGTMGRAESPVDDDPDASIPFRPADDEGDGISAADRERFG
jgi:hypothetical protein